MSDLYEFGFSGMAPMSGGGVAAMRNAPDGRVVRFERRSILNKAKSRAAGHPVYDADDFITIMFPGDKSTVIDHPAQPWEKRLYRDAWQSYQDKKQPEQTGTPLEFLFPDNPEIVMGMKAVHIFNVEALAGLTDTNAQGLKFGSAHRDRAKKYLDGQKKGGGFHELESKIATQAHENAQLLERIAALETKLSTGADETPRRGPGRPRNEA